MLGITLGARTTALSKMTVGQFETVRVREEDCTSILTKLAVCLALPKSRRAG